MQVTRVALVSRFVAICIVAQILTFCSQPRCLNSLRVDVATADSAVHLTISFASPTTSSLNLDTRRNVLPITSTISQRQSLCFA